MQTKIMYVLLFFLLHYSALVFSQVAANKINNEPDQKIQDRNIYLKDSLLLDEINDKPITDTSKYMNDFFSFHKDKYIGKRLNSLLAALRIPIKSYSIDIMWGPSNNIIEELRLSSFNRSKTTNKLLNHNTKYFEIWIEFSGKVVTDKHQSESLNWFDWSEKEVILFGNNIIKDLFLAQAIIGMTASNK